MACAAWNLYSYQPYMRKAINIRDIGLLNTRIDLIPAYNAQVYLFYKTKLHLCLFYFYF